MTRAQYCRRLAGLALSVALAACSSPNPALYTLHEPDPQRRQAGGSPGRTDDKNEMVINLKAAKALGLTIPQ